MKIFIVVVLVLMPTFTGCLNSSKSSSDIDQPDNSVHGVVSCTSSCEPIDVANCNNVEAGEPVLTCFLVSQTCSSPSDEQGPEISSFAPPGCTAVNPLPVGFGGEAPVVAETPPLVTQSF